MTSGDNSFENVLNIPGPVSSNHWSVTPTPGPNIVNGPYIGGNYWATPTRTGWSQTHPDIGNGFTIPYDINSDGLNIDTHPLTLNGPAPTPSPSGTSGTFTPYSMTFELPYDATFTGNTVPANMQPCNSYNVLLTVKNTGTLNWSSANGVYLASSSTNGFTFDPSKYPIPAGVVVHPGDSYTFPVTINVPCPMNSGTYPLRFSLFYTLQTREGPVTLPFGEALIDNVNVGTTTATSSGVKMGVKTFIPSSTNSGVSTGSALRQFPTIIPRPDVTSQAINPVTRYYAGTSRDIINKTVVRNFNAITGLLWAVL